jgi:hypothetical protein
VGVERFTNNAASTLAAAITSTSATSLIITSNTGFPSVTTASGDWFRVVIDSEIIFVTDNSSTTWTISRGQEGSTAAMHSSGAAVTHVVTAYRMASSVQSGNAQAHKHTVDVLASPPSSPGTGDLWTVRDVNSTTSGLVTGPELDSVATSRVFTVPSTNTWTDVSEMLLTVPAGEPFECLISAMMTCTPNATPPSTAVACQVRVVDYATKAKIYAFAAWQDVFSASQARINPVCVSQDNDPLTAETVCILQALASNNANLTWTLYSAVSTVPGVKVTVRRR